jgi:hypothetical protein
LNSYLDELQSLKLALESSECDSIDIGNSVFVKKSALSALKSVSPKVNIYARHIFKHVFETHEVVGRSLMGKTCNARKEANVTASVDERKRDAVMRKEDVCKMLSTNFMHSISEHALVSFNVGPGSAFYHLALKDVKHSLSNLINEINRDAKKTEESIPEMNEQL